MIGSGGRCGMRYIIWKKLSHYFYFDLQAVGLSNVKILQQVCRPNSIILNGFEWINYFVGNSALFLWLAVPRFHFRIRHVHIFLLCYTLLHIWEYSHQCGVLLTALSFSPTPSLLPSTSLRWAWKNAGGHKSELPSWRWIALLTFIWIRMENAVQWEWKRFVMILFIECTDFCQILPHRKSLLWKWLVLINPTWFVT